jgi:sec-independent protein translocase protein TatA
MPAILGTFGIQELLVIFLILVLLFGSTKLPQIGRGIGEGIRNLKSGLKADDEPRPAIDEKAEEKGRSA